MSIPRRFATKVEQELAQWSKAFDALVVQHDPDAGPGRCDECGAETLVFGLASAVTRSCTGPTVCRTCAIAGGMRVRARQITPM